MAILEMIAGLALAFAIIVPIGMWYIKAREDYKNEHDN